MEANLLALGERDAEKCSDDEAWQYGRSVAPDPELRNAHCSTRLLLKNTWPSLAAFARLRV
jgi:hypothetical protein